MTRAAQGLTPLSGQPLASGSTVAWLERVRRHSYWMTEDEVWAWADHSSVEGTTILRLDSELSRCGSHRNGRWVSTHPVQA